MTTHVHRTEQVTSCGGHQHPGIADAEAGSVARSIVRLKGNMPPRRGRPLCLPLLVLGFITVAAPLHVVRSQQPAPLARAERLLDSLLADGAPGAAVVIVHNGRVVLSKGLGTGSIETGAPVTPDMLFRVGVASPLLVNLALLSLADKGKLDLHAPIGRYVSGLSPKLAAVTTHQLLTGTSGLRNDHPSFPLHGDSALGKAIRAWTDTMFIAEPGQLSSISNPSHQVAGLVLEEISGKPFSQAMGQGLLRDLGMTRATYDPGVAMTYPIALAHMDGPPGNPAKVVRPSNFGVFGWPRSDLFSSASDLSRLMLAILGDGKLDGKQVVSRTVIRRFSAIVTVRDGRPGAERQTAYGIMTRDYRGVRQGADGSSWQGNYGQLRIAPDHRFAILILTNGRAPRMTNIAEKVMELMLPMHPPPKPVAPPPATPLDAADISEVAGVYENERTVTLLAKGGRLFAREEMTPSNRALAQRGIGVVGPFSIWDADLPVLRVKPDELIIEMPDGGRVPVELIRGLQNRVVYLRIEGRALRKR